MATQITYQSCFDDDFIPATRLREVEATTDSDKVTAVLYLRGANGDEQVYYVVLYAVDGKVTLYSLDELINDSLRARGLAMGEFNLRFADATQSFTAIYCEQEPPADWEEALYPLTPTSVRRVHADSTIAFSVAQYAAERPWIISVVGLSAETGRIVSCQRESYAQPANGSVWVEFKVWDILKWALYGSDGSSLPPFSRVSYISIEYWGEQQLYYLTPAAAYLTFRFRNAFNCVEYIDVVGVMSSKLDISRNEAVCGGIVTQYDRTVRREYTVETEAVPDNEAELMSQFLASHSVELVLPSGECRVIIADVSWEPSSDDAKLSSAKFTWSFADTRQRSFASDFKGIMPTRRSIFTSQFAPVYE